jgi:hypothetical protein
MADIFFKSREKDENMKHLAAAALLSALVSAPLSAAEDNDYQKRQTLGYIATVAPKLLLIRCAGNKLSTVDEMYFCFDAALNEMNESELPRGIAMLSHGSYQTRRYWNFEECMRRRDAGAVCNIR